MNASILSQIDSIAEEGIRLKAYPGCHVMILREGLPVYNKCFGSYTYEGKEAVKENSLYDLASLTKVTATLLAVMKLYDEGKFGLTDRVADYLPILKKRISRVLRYRICCSMNLGYLPTGLSMRRL